MLSRTKRRAARCNNHTWRCRRISSTTSRRSCSHSRLSTVRCCRISRSNRTSSMVARRSYNSRTACRTKKSSMRCRPTRRRPSRKLSLRSTCKRCPCSKLLPTCLRSRSLTYSSKMNSPLLQPMRLTCSPRTCSLKTSKCTYSKCCRIASCSNSSTCCRNSR